MCGRYTLLHELDALFDYYQSVPADLSYQISFNIAPSQSVIAVVNDGNQNRIGQLKWGLVPAWADDPKIGYKMINARAETIDQKSAFKSLLSRRRCVIPADSFFEWRKTPERKIPMRIRLKNESLFSFAGLWDRWEKDGKAIQSCTIITTQPNTLMENIHNRMPVILTKGAEKEWLNPAIKDPVQLKNLLIPYQSEDMEAYEVSSIVNSPKNNQPEVIEPVS